jgi:hypothetical protein
MKRADSNVCTPLVHVHPGADERFTVMEGIRIGVQASPRLADDSTAQFTAQSFS